MNIVSNLLVFFSLCFSILISGCVNQAGPKKETGLIDPLPFRPNILWITCEDMSQNLASFGDSTVKTPNIDRLAREGIRFVNTFAVSGVCAPSRSSIITGMYPTSIGTHHMRTLQKIHPDVPRYSVVIPPQVKCFTEYLRMAGFYCTNNVKEDYQFIAPPTAWDESSRKAHFRNRPANKPFFSIFNFIDSHESQVWKRNTDPLMEVNPSEVPLPPYYPDTEKVRNDVAGYYKNITMMDKQVGDVLQWLEEDGLLDSTIIFFFSDHGAGLPRAKRWIYDSGIKVPLIVKFPDQRLAGSVEEELISFIDLAPTVLSLAGVKIPSHIQGQAFLGARKAKDPRKYIYAARDRLDNRYDLIRAVRDHQYKYIRNYQPEKPYIQEIPYRDQMNIMQELYRWEKEQKLDPVQSLWAQKSKPLEELYDVNSDPHEIRNLAADTTYSKELKRLRAAHEKWTSETRDLGHRPELELLAEMWPSGVAPVTADPQIINEDGALKIICDTPGASLAYRYPENEGSTWHVYSDTIHISDTRRIEAMAMRIGYAGSQIVSYPSDLRSYR